MKSKLGIAVVVAALGSVLFSHFSHREATDPQASPFPTEAASAAPLKAMADAAAATPQVSADHPAKPAAAGKGKNEIALAAYNEDYPTLDFRLNEMSARRNGKSFDQAAVAAAMRQPSAWQIDPGVADKLNLDNDERYDGREFIRFSPMKLESLMPGDTLEIPIAQQNATYEMVVDGVRAHTDGNVTWYGHLKDFPSDNQVAITRGDDLTVGGITLQDKQYTLQANGEAGWLVESFTLFKGKDQHLLPDAAGQTPHAHADAHGADHDHDQQG